MNKNLSASKRDQIALRNRSRNKVYKAAIKKSIKQYVLCIANNVDLYTKNKYLSILYQKIDKAVSKGIIHKNKGARKKSRLSRMLKLV